MTIWALLAAAAGLLVGFGLNPIITRMATAANAANPLPPARHPLLGGPAWVGVGVALLTATMSLVLFLRLGWGWRFGYWLAMSIVMILVGAVDWKVRLIDVLFLLVMTLATLVAAPWVGVGLKSALLGGVVGGIVFTLFFIVAQMMFPGPGVPFGLGDVYLALFIGTLVGLGNLGVALFYGMALAGLASLALLGARQMGKTEALYISYGTYLCLGVLIFLACFVQRY